VKDSKSRKTKGLKEYERVDNTSEKAPDDEDAGEINPVKSRVCENKGQDLRPNYDQIINHI
jgi:hypothetical protein